MQPAPPEDDRLCTKIGPSQRRLAVHEKAGAANHVRRRVRELRGRKVAAKKTPEASPSPGRSLMRGCCGGEGYVVWLRGEGPAVADNLKSCWYGFRCRAFSSGAPRSVSEDPGFFWMRHPSGFAVKRLPFVDLGRLNYSFVMSFSRRRRSFPTL